MKIIFNGKNDKINECVKFINELFEDKNSEYISFWQEVESAPQFDYSTISSTAISEQLQNCNSSVTIRLYKPWWRFSKANAYVSGKYPNTLFLNKRKLYRNHESIVNTIFHECVHIADYGDNDEKVTFGHGNNSSKGKENTAPYWIGKLAGQYFLHQDDDDMELEKVELEDDLIE